MSDQETPAPLPDKLYFRIGEVAEIVGVEPHVLRYWENEFRMNPHRSSSGQRLYRKQDITRFLRIRKLLHTEGFTIAGARKALSNRDNSARNEPGVDLEKLREAAERLQALRADIKVLRDDINALTPLGADVNSGGLPDGA